LITGKIMDKIIGLAITVDTKENSIDFGNEFGRELSRGSALEEKGEDAEAGAGAEAEAEGKKTGRASGGDTKEFNSRGVGGGAGLPRGAEVGLPRGASSGESPVLSPVCKLPCPPPIKSMIYQKYCPGLITVIRNISSSPTCFK
jgi:hypothetical protein